MVEDHKIDPKEERLAAFLSDYQPLSGGSDELLSADGSIRPGWRSFVEFLAQLDPQEVARRFARGNQYLRDAGVFYRQYDADAKPERDWPLSHVPVILEQDDWDVITSGLKERADLLEMVVSDIYGAQRLVTEGHLPAELIAKSAEWIRPMMGARPRNGHFLNYLAFEIARGPDGQWWVLGDRTEAPSGAGFALENRVATKNMFPDFYRRANIHRLAGFFRHFRDHLLSQQIGTDTGVAILTPGWHNDSYYEHAYIARYLGFMLLEGEDITVANGQTMVRTVDGLKPLDVIWRRFDAFFIDPLELISDSMIGTPGLLEQVRSGRVHMINCPGSGILESRFMLAFLPRISEAIFGKPLAIPNIATWWCGQQSQRDYVLSHSNMMIGSAYDVTMPFESDDMNQLDLDHAALPIREMIRSVGAEYVGQEPVRLSTTPAMVKNRLVARPMAIRIIMARTENGWEAMPGGYARIAQDAGQSLLALQRGGQVADVWVRSQQAVQTESLAVLDENAYIRRMPEVLPSRVADNNFWMGRYIERAEALTRMVRAYHRRLEEVGSHDSRLLSIFQDYLGYYGVQEQEAIPLALCQALDSAIVSAGHLRDRYSTDGWTALKDLLDAALEMKETVAPGTDTVDAAQLLLRQISSLSGLIQESMYQHLAWRFLKMGRALERGVMLSHTLGHFTRAGVPDGALDIPVDIGDSAITHRRRYVVSTNRDTVIDLLALDPHNPRSILYQVNECKEHISYLPTERDRLQPNELTRAALKLQTDLTIIPAAQVTTTFLGGVETSLLGLSDLLSSTYFR